MNPPSKKSEKKKEPEAARYEQADPRTTSPVPSIGEPGKPFYRPEGDAPPAVLLSDRIRNPKGLRAIRQEALAAS